MVRLWLAALVVSASFAALAPPAAAPGTLVADAGDSVLVVDQAKIALRGRAFGGTAPYTFAWSAPGGAFDPVWRPAHGDAATNLSVAWMPVGDHVVQLTVTDSSGATASDAVKVRRVAPYTALDETRATRPGTAGLLVHRIPFPVFVGTARLDATLDWTRSVDDLDFVLQDRRESDRTANQGRTGNKPERATATNPEPGTWSFVIEPFLAAPDTARAVVTAWPDGNLPRIDPMDKYHYGTLDVQKLPVNVRRGEAPLAVAWDLDLDGVYETPGEDPVVSLPVGTRTVAVKVTDAAGFEHRRTTEVTIRDDVDRVLRIGCGGIHDRAFEAMEYSASNGTCFMHGGHHTYDLGGPVTLRGGKAFVRAVEQHLAPPADPRVAGTTPFFPVVLETSLDGIAWTETSAGRYMTGLAAIPDRQTVQWTFGASPEPFRFARLRAPHSTTQGLSGFLDYSEGSLEVDVADVPTPTPVPGRARNLTCEKDLMEDVFATHPCWFGGLDRYDSASFFHTYFLADEPQVERVHGTFTVLPWRTDDWFDLNDTEQTLGTQVTLETSADGRTWTARATVPAAFGEETRFDVSLAPAGTVRWVRLLADWHPDFADPTLDPLHHREAYFVQSHVVVQEPSTGG